tara:strand:+ start:378 stop:815 length:438 start_codon:yes stop_codon:yes gene_type:complete
MIPFIGPIMNAAGSFLGPIAEGFAGKIKAKAELRVLEAKREVIKEEKSQERLTALATSDVNWDRVMAEGSQSSWKDEFWTIIFAIPLLLSFIPAMAGYVEIGFRALEQTPEWYRYCLLTLVAASVGRHEIPRIGKKIIGLKGPKK